MKFAFLASFILICAALFGQSNYFQSYQFTEADSLRGHLNENRSCFNVIHYDLSVDINTSNKTIAGQNMISFVMLKNSLQIQIDLFEQYHIDKVQLPNQNLKFKRLAACMVIDNPKGFIEGETYHLVISYHGKPQIAKRPPWSGGFVWEKDSMNRPLYGVACEGLGASAWWPCKDHLSDEPDSMDIRLSIDKELDIISNGRLISTTKTKQKSEAHWHVSYPINTYNVSFYIGNYAHFSDKYKALDLDYYVLDYHIKPAKKHFEQVKTMLRVFSKTVGNYPFFNDGYKLVESSYWGMEHQSAIAYGNHFLNNEYGFDFIIIHESGHEWFGNQVSVCDHADMWIHESFTTYLEAVYVEETKGYSTMVKYMNDQREKIKNHMPIQGPTDVNFGDWPDADMYYKGTWVLHTLRTLIENDSVWFSILNGIQTDFTTHCVDSKTIVNYISEASGIDLRDFFNQYLNQTHIPTLEYKLERVEGNTILKYRYANVVDHFDMPIRVKIDTSAEFEWLYPVKDFWKEKQIIPASNQEITFDKDHFLVDFKLLK